MKKKIAKELRRRKQRIQYRLRDINWKEQGKPMFAAGNIHYEIADRSRGLAYGGIGAMHLLARQTVLITAIDDKLSLLRRRPCRGGATSAVSRIGSCPEYRLQPSL